MKKCTKRFFSAQCSQNFSQCSNWVIYNFQAKGDLQFHYNLIKRFIVSLNLNCPSALVFGSYSAEISLFPRAIQVNSSGKKQIFFKKLSICGFLKRDEVGLFPFISRHAIKFKGPKDGPLEVSLCLGLSNSNYVAVVQCSSDWFGFILPVTLESQRTVLVLHLLEFGTELEWLGTFENLTHVENSKEVIFRPKKPSTSSRDFKSIYNGVYFSDDVLSELSKCLRYLHRLPAKLVQFYSA
jgi:hypothetical protein